MMRGALRAVRLAVGVFGWLFAAVVGLEALVEVAHLDRWWLMVGLVAVSPWLYLLMWAVTGAAALAGRFRLVAASAALGVLGVAWVLPPYLPIHRAAAAPVGSIPVRVFDANVRYDNPDMSGIAAEIRDYGPDLITLEELSPSNLASLRSTHVLDGYRWSFVRPATSADGFGLWSREPLAQTAVWYAGSHPELTTDLTLANGRVVRVLVVHTHAPRSGAVAEWKSELSAIATHVGTSPRPLVVAGDFNATTGMYEFRRILHNGLDDAAAEAGKGWELTWSRMTRVLPPLVRIDHVLYSRGLTVTSYRTGYGAGSDHRPILTTLALLPAQPPAK